MDTDFKQQLLLVAMANPEFIKVVRIDNERHTVESTFAIKANKIISDLAQLALKQ